MAFRDIAAEWLNTIPEIRLLAAISAKCGAPIAIHGSVARNLLVRALRYDQGLSKEPPSFVDLIDPLGDVDLIVPSQALVEAVYSAVFSRIGIAPALRWEIQTTQEIGALREAGAFTSLDRIQIFITGQSVYFEYTEPAVADLERRVLSGGIPRSWSLRQDAFIGADISQFVLRVARYAAQFELEIDGELGHAIASVAREQRTVPMRRGETVRLAILHVLFNGRDLKDAARHLQWSRETVPALARQHGELLEAAHAGAARNLMHAVVYPASDVSRLVSEFHPFGPVEPSEVRRHQSAVPWVPIRLPQTLPCCPSGDFSLGPLTVVWRGIGRPEVERLGAIVSTAVEQRYHESAPPVFAAPGLLLAGHSISLRLDWGFAAAVVGPGREVYVGAAPALLHPESR